MPTDGRSLSPQALTGIVIVGALACYIPGRRVLRVDPATALRSA